MNFTSIFNILLLIGFAQGFVFNIVSFFTKKLRIKAHLYLNLLVFFLSLNNLEAWLNSNHIRFNNYYLADLHTPWYILLAPFLYLFLSEYLGFSKKKYILRIGLLFFSSLTIIKLFFLYINKQTDTLILSKKLLVFNQMAEAVGFSITISIFIYAYRMYKKKENKIHQYKMDDLNWLHVFFKISLFILLLWILVLIVMILTDWNIYVLLHISVSFLIYWIAYMGTHKQSLFTERISLRSFTRQQDNQIKNDSKGTIKEFEITFNQVRAYLIDSEIYTNPLLSIEDLAKELEITKNSLSQIINTKSSNFSYLINQLRIEKAKSFLIDKSFKHYSILAIGLEAGFNSKSTFYAAFKEFTGQTPKVWQEANS